MRISLLLLFLAVPAVAQDSSTDRQVKRAVKRFRQLFDHPKAKQIDKVRLIKELGRIHHPEVAKELSLLCRKDTLAVRLNAVRTLQKFKNVKGVGRALVFALESPSNSGKEWLGVQITILRAIGNRKYRPAGDAVFLPAFTFVATAEIAALRGATPVFVDVLADTFNMDPESLDAAIGVAEGIGLRPRVVIPVDLFGQPADYGRIGTIADKHGLTVVADAAQSFGASINGRRVGTFGAYTATSFFPAKPLGCYGDGGAVFTDDDEKAEILRSLRVHGKGLEKYDNVRVGLNSRLDTLQAAILIEKLTILKDEIEARNVVAKRYTAALADIVKVPKVIDGVRSVWAQYTIQIDDGDRARARLKAAGVPTAVYYPKPLHQQTAYEDFPVAAGGLAVSERLSRSVLSLPMHPYLEKATQNCVVTAVREAVLG